MFEEYQKLFKRYVIYLLLVEPGFYKFGVTGRLIDRLRTHKRHLKFAQIVSIFICPSRESSFRVEQKFKRYAREKGILVNKYNKTEIINTDEPQKYVEWFAREVYMETNMIGPSITIDRIQFGLNSSHLKLSPLWANNNAHNVKLHVRDRESDLAVIKVSSSPDGEKIRSPKKYVLKHHSISKKTNNKSNTINGNSSESNRKCGTCGKIFRTPAEYIRHAKRITPCGILATTETTINNPNRCQYCNRTYSKKENLTRHLTLCKIKKHAAHHNRAVAQDKIYREIEELRILREDFKTVVEKDNKEFYATIKSMREEIQDLKSQIARQSEPALLDE